jgi:hypothetical protein
MRILGAQRARNRRRLLTEVPKHEDNRESDRSLMPSDLGMGRLALQTGREDSLSLSKPVPAARVRSPVVFRQLF